ncbi:MAG: hypothetical protein IIA12_08485, partial [Proteobacteria bacterium]|nr:hypothetical protein [Pseudomonadota bacterium]
MFCISNVKRVAIFLLSAILVIACESKTPVSEESLTTTGQRSIEAIADDYLAAMLERNPTMATSYAIEGARHDRLF